MATSRPSLVSRARNTSPIPPAPSRDSIEVRADLPADEIARGGSGRRQEVRGWILRQQRFDVAANILFAVTRLAYEGAALLRVAPKRLVIQLQHPLPAVGRHGQITGTALMLRLAALF